VPRVHLAACVPPLLPLQRAVRASFARPVSRPPRHAPPDFIVRTQRFRSRARPAVSALPARRPLPRVQAAWPESTGAPSVPRRPTQCVRLVSLDRPFRLQPTQRPAPDATPARASSSRMHAQSARTLFVPPVQLAAIALIRPLSCLAIQEMSASQAPQLSHRVQLASCAQLLPPRWHASCRTIAL